MHEYSIVQALLERVDGEVLSRNASRVHTLRICIGDVSGVEVDLLRTAYETIRRGTSCADATLDIRTAAAVWACPHCGGDIPRGAPLQCAECRLPARLVSGDEILLEQIEMEVP